jgi:hypothetical protein
MSKAIIFGLLNVIAAIGSLNFVYGAITGKMSPHFPWFIYVGFSYFCHRPTTNLTFFTYIYYLANTNY